MRNDLLTLMRRLFGRHKPSPALELVFADWPSDGRNAKPRSMPRRELLHPMKGWQEEERAGVPGAGDLFRKGRQPTYLWPAGK